MSCSVLCLDAGTSSLKGAVISSEGKLISCGRVYCSSDYAIRLEALKRLVSSLDGINFISAIAVSGNGPTLIPLNWDNSFERPILWFEKKNVRYDSMESLYLPEVLWLKQNYPAIYTRVKTFLTSDGFFNYVLTGKAYSPVFSERFLPFFWTDCQLDDLTLDRSKFPDAVMAGDAVGVVTAETASWFGIKAGIPVFAGGSDFLMAILGSGVLKPGMICDRAGTSEGINYCCAERREFPGRRTMPHVSEKYWNISGLIPDSGSLFAWIRELSADSQLNLNNYLLTAYKKMMAGYDFDLLPVRGKGSELRILRDDIIRYAGSHSMDDVVGAAAYTLANAVSCIIRDFERNDLPVAEVRVSGGQAADTTWNMIKSLITGKKITVPEIADGELMGCACAAFRGLGLYGSVCAAAADLVRIRPF